MPLLCLYTSATVCVCVHHKWSFTAQTFLETESSVSMNKVCKIHTVLVDVYAYAPRVAAWASQYMHVFIWVFLSYFTNLLVVRHPDICWAPNHHQLSHCPPCSKHNRSIKKARRHDKDAWAWQGTQAIKHWILLTILLLSAVLSSVKTSLQTNS